MGYLYIELNHNGFFFGGGVFQNVCMALEFSPILEIKGRYINHV